MEGLLLAAGLGVTALYLALVASNFLGMGRLRPGRNEGSPPVSVLVAARDEEDHLPRCLDALLAQDYAARAPLEIVVVDDRSQDATSRILAGYAARDPRVVALRVDACPPGTSPKMSALSHAVEKASGEVLCVTDADCVPPPGWVHAVVAHFEDDVGLVAGPALRLPVDGRRSFLADIARIASVIGSAMAAGGSAWGMPWTCSGANLAYRREAFEALGGYTRLCHVASGDDDLLVQEMALRSPWRVAYAFSQEACVPSFEHAEAGAFASRQVRHQARFLDHPRRVQAMSLVVFGQYIWFLCGPLLALASTPLGLAWLGTTLVRVPADLAALRRCADRIGATLDGRALARALPAFPAMLVLSALAGLRGRFTWKGERYVRRRTWRSSAARKPAAPRRRAPAAWRVPR